VDEELKILRTEPMSTALAALSAASMRLGQPSYVDISQRMGDIVLGIPHQCYEKWLKSLDAESHEDPNSEPTPNVVRYATKTVGPDYLTFTIRSTF
jgi:hypothetical protein